MTDKENKNPTRHRSLLGFIILAFFFIFISGVLVWFFTPIGKPIPTITLVQPNKNLLVHSGDGVNVVARGESRNGFDHYEFFVDDLPAGNRETTDPAARTESISFQWFSSQPGIHKLGVVAVNSTGQSSAPAEILVAVQSRSISQVIQTQDEGVANSGDEVGDGSSASESGDDDGTDSDEQVSGEEQMDLEQMLDDVDPEGDFPVVITDEPVDAIPRVEQFDVTTSLVGGEANVIINIMGSDDLGLVMIAFNLTSMDDPLNPMPENHSCGGTLTCGMDVSLLLGEGGWILSVQAFDISGQVSEVHTRQIHVLAGGNPPAIAEDDEDGVIRLDPEIPWDEVVVFDDPMDDIGDPVIAEYGCSGQTVFLDVPYTFLSDHGSEVYLGAMAEKDHVLVAAGHALIHPGVGMARIEMEAIAPDLMDQTDSLNLYFRKGEDYFYEETVAIGIYWPIPEPDLNIAYLSQEEALLRVDVRNIGCTAVDGFDLQFNLIDDQVLVEHVDHYLAQGITYTWEGFITPEIFGQGFEVIVDPQNLIPEINEENNVGSLGPITIKRIEFYKIDIHNISEGLGRGKKGEFCFFVELYDNGFFDYRFPPNLNSFYVYGAGEHYIYRSTGQGLIAGLFAHPMLNWDRDLTVGFTVYEDDDYSYDDLGYVEMTFPADFFNENSWKRGGEYSGTSDKGYFTIYFRIILNDR